MTVTTTGWVAIGLWATVGLAAGILFAVLTERPGRDPDTPPPGVIAFSVWVLFPLCLIFGAIAGLIWLINEACRWTGRRLDS